MHVVKEMVAGYLCNERKYVSEQHLDRYIGEFVYRYNNRKITDATGAVKALKGAEGKRLVYKDTIKKADD